MCVDAVCLDALIDGRVEVLCLTGCVVPLVVPTPCLLEPQVAVVFFGSLFDH